MQPRNRCMVFLYIFFFLKTKHVLLYPAQGTDIPYTVHKEFLIIISVRGLMENIYKVHTNHLIIHELKLNSYDSVCTAISMNMSCFIPDRMPLDHKNHCLLILSKTHTIFLKILKTLLFIKAASTLYYL